MTSARLMTAANSVLQRFVLSFHYFLPPLFRIALNLTSESDYNNNQQNSCGLDNALLQQENNHFFTCAVIEKEPAHTAMVLARLLGFRFIGLLGLYKLLVSLYSCNL